MGYFNHNFLLYIIFGLLGLAAGSFINSYAWRYGTGKRPGARSVCVHCGKRLNWWENIPVFSYVFLKGKCRTCHGSIPWHYPLVEIAMAILFFFLSVILPTIFGESFGLLLWWRVINYFLFAFVLAVVFVVDAKYMLIPVELVVMASISFLFFNIFSNAGIANIIFWPAVGGGFFLVQRLLTRGEGMGGGDTWLGILLGLVFGINIIFVIAIAYVSALLYAVPLLLRKKKDLKSAVPIGAFLAIAAIAFVLLPLFLIFFVPVTINN